MTSPAPSEQADTRPSSMLDDEAQKILSDAVKSISPKIWESIAAAQQTVPQGGGADLRFIRTRGTADAFIY